MWHHFLNLLAQSRDSFLAALGTTGLGWWVQGIIWILITEAVTYVVIWIARGTKAMKSRAKENLLIGLVASAIVIVCIYGPIFAWNIIKVVYADHESLARRVEELKNTQLKTRETSLVHPKDRDDEIARLKRENEKLKSTADTCQASLRAVQVNPYAPKVTYFFDGSKKVESSGDISFYKGTNEDEYFAFLRMKDLELQADWKSLASLCEKEMTKLQRGLPHTCMPGKRMYT